MKKQLIALRGIIIEMSRQRYVQVILAVSIAILIATFLIPYFQLYPEIMTKTAVPLHYNIHFGVDLFGAWWRVLMPSMVGLAILIINSVLAVIYWRADRMLSYCVLIIMPVLGIFLILASVFITLLNLSYD
ncbi:hypothetical protein KJ673_03350 [Patescibacteria group bacterium]|nr:hypothetical protein [Patescibacteria group bacterium]MCG2687882.1 hypothetical protein [Candidatus Parcubacteria bacterium]